MERPSKRKCFIVLGYGIPKNIRQDYAYRKYLGFVFNALFDEGKDGARPVIIFSGGPTDCFPPYRRTEAAEMVKFFRTLMARPSVRRGTRGWQLISERRSLDTLENLLNSRTALRRRDVRSGRLRIFCEHTRRARVRVLARHVFGPRFRTVVTAVDFDESANRYIDPQFLANKERQSLRRAVWVLNHPSERRAYHALFEEKIKRFRRAGPAQHITAIEQWWRSQLG